MQPIGPLMIEHRLIERLIGLMGQELKRIKDNVAVEPEFAFVDPVFIDTAVDFIRTYADRCHHGKEEELLFPRLTERGMPTHSGPIQVMLAEHDEGRTLIRRMKETAEAYARENREAGKEWSLAAHAYVSLLREHILKENEILFVMAERLLSEEDQNELSAAFEDVEKEKLGAGEHERLHALMEQIKSEIRLSNAAGPAGPRAAGPLD